MTTSLLEKYRQAPHNPGVYLMKDAKAKTIYVGNEKHPLLIIDDFGLKPFKSGQDEDFHDLIADRYERTATIITSNLDFTEWGDAFPNKLLGASTLDRLLHGAYRLVMDGKSYRKPRPLKQPSKDQLANGSKKEK